jgi:3-oxoadipate enol-lactonase
MSSGHPASVRHVDLGQTRMTYQRLGLPAGAPVLLIHPWFGCPRFWKPVLPSLSMSRCLLIDLYSPALGPWTEIANARSLADGLLAVLDAEHIDAATVIGNSMGGILAQLLAAEHPARVDRLVLIGTGATSAGLNSRFAGQLAVWLEKRDRAGLEALTRSLVAPRAAQEPIVDACVKAVQAVDPDYLAAIPRATLGLDLRPILGAITAPTLVVRGALDAIRTQAHAEELSHGIRKARSVELDGAGHSPMVDSSRAFNRILLDFLAE